ncbi:MAG: FtsX-like permease family protein [Nitrososphaerota archaeon]
MTSLLNLAFKSVIADISKSMLYILTIGFLLTVASAPIVIANGYSENLYTMLPKFEEERFLLINASAKSLNESFLDYSLTERLVSLGFKKFFPQLIFYSKAFFNDKLFDIKVRGIDRLEEYFKHNRFHVDGNIPSSSSEVAIGILIARRFGVEKGVFLRIFSHDEDFKDFRVSSIIDCRCPSDEEVLAPLSTVWDIRPDILGRISLIEIISSEEINPATLYSLDVKVLEERSFYQAAYSLILKTFNSIRNWSTPIYLLVLTAVYVVSVRITRDSEKDVTIIRCIGASRWKIFRYLFYRCFIVAVFGILVGISFGVVSAQVIFRFVSIILSTGSYTPPNIDTLDLVWLIGFSLLSSTAGIIYPAFKEMRRRLSDLTWRLTYP